LVISSQVGKSAEVAAKYTFQSSSLFSLSLAESSFPPIHPAIEALAISKQSSIAIFLFIHYTGNEY
jgi:hypothetical protein